MLAHLVVVVIGFGLFWLAHTRITDPKLKLIASVVIIGLTLGGLIVDAPKDCKETAKPSASLAPAIAPDSAR